MTEETVAMIERNIVCNAQYVRRMWRKIRSKGFARTYGRTVSLVGETMIAKRYSGMSLDEIADWYMTVVEWVGFVGNIDAAGFGRRFVSESDAPLFFKAFMMAAMRVFCHRTHPMACKRTAEDGNDPDAVDGVFAAIEGKGPAGSLIMFSLYGVTITPSILRRLLVEGRHAVVECLIEHDKESVDKVISGSELIGIITEQFPYPDSDSVHDFLKLLSTTASHYPDELSEFCLA